MSQQLSSEEINRLLEAAREARNKAYAPYSGFRVGAALLTGSGDVFTGCNVENVSYGLTNCAERTAVFKAVSEGHQDFKALAIIADTDRYCAPCGACRQVLAEFGNFPVIQAADNGTYNVNSVEELLPGGFSAGILGKEIVE